MTNICCIGHITLDKVITPRFEAYMPGGPAYYFAKALAGFDHDDFRLVTALGEPEMGVVDELRADGIDVTVLPARKSVFFENRYDEDTNKRTQRVLEKSDPFTIKNLSGIEGEIFHLGTLLADDFDLDTIKALAQKGHVSVDVQGFLRKVVGEDVVSTDYELKREAMPYISILKADRNEMEVITGVSDPEKAAKILAEWGCREVVLTMGDLGSYIYAGGEGYRIPAFPPADHVDATGCGDTYMAGYLYKRSRGAGYEEAGIFAAAMCSLKLANKGPFRGTEADVTAFLEKE